mmetsp:Transcript_66770/g.105642  ORF Transcript_66770/g.105642 Transcript_66770/m.105642 type:complete len:400 (-) Transcript_66770:1345-2544(-)
MAREDAESLVHVSLDLASPLSLKNCCALDQEVQTCKLHAFVSNLLEEDQGFAHCPCVLVAMLPSRNIQLGVQVFHKLLRASFLIVNMLERFDNLGLRNDFVIIPALLMVDTHGIACTTHLDDLQDTTIPQLLCYPFSIVDVRLVLGVGLDAPDKVWVCFVNDLHERAELGLELRRNRILCFLLLGVLFSIWVRKCLLVLDIVSEQILDEIQAAIPHAFDNIIAELILVLIQERICAVGNWSSKVLDHKPSRLHLYHIEATMTCVLSNDFVAETRIGAIGNSAFLIEHRKDATNFGIRQDLHRILVVREIQRIPRNLLSSIKLLLELEHERIEELLQTFVREVDAQLLKRVHLETLEAEDVQHASKEFNVIQVTNGSVRLRNNETKNNAVKSLRKRIAIV